MPNTPADEQRINAIRFLSVDAVDEAKSSHPGLPLGAAGQAYALWMRQRAILLDLKAGNPRQCRGSANQ
ncbi:MAG: hypothetical protein WA728_07815 [Xanthobacteraceae bacterium]